MKPARTARTGKARNLSPRAIYVVLSRLTLWVRRGFTRRRNHRGGALAALVTAVFVAPTAAHAQSGKPFSFSSALSIDGSSSNREGTAANTAAFPFLTAANPYLAPPPAILPPESDTLRTSAITGGFAHAPEPDAAALWLTGVIGAALFGRSRLRRGQNPSRTDLPGGL